MTMKRGCDKSRGKHKTWICVCMSLFLLICAIGFVGKGVKAMAAGNDTDENKRFELEVNVGFNNCGKMDTDLLATVTVTNHGKDFAGKIELLFPVDAKDGDSPVYQTSISVAAGKTKTISIPVWLYFYSEKIVTSVLDEKDRVLQEDEQKIFLYGMRQELAGVLTDQEDELDYLGWTDSDGDNTNIEYISAKDFPEQKEVLKCLDQLVVDDFDTKTWSKKQYEAVTEWVKEGGVLILGTGASGEKTLAGFKSDFLKGEIKKINKDGIAELDVPEGELVKSTDGSVTMVKIKKENGWIYIIPEDLVMEYESWRTKGTAYKKMLDENVQRDQNGDIFSFVGRRDRGLTVIDKEKLPNSFPYGVVLFLYAAVVSVGLFWVLKKKDRLEWTWKLVPVLAVIGSIIIFVMGTKTRISTPEINYSRRVEYTGEGEKTAIAQMDLAVTSPYNETYSIAVPKEETVYIRGNSSGSDLPGWDDSEKEYKSGRVIFRKSKEQQMVTFKNFGAFESAFLGTKEKTMDAAGTYHSDITCEKYEYSGTFTNETGQDICHAFFMAGGRIYKLGDIKSGETVSISNQLKNGFSVNQTAYTNVGYGENSRFGEFCDIGHIFTAEGYTKDATTEEVQYANAIRNYFYSDASKRVMEPKVIGALNSEETNQSLSEEWGMNCDGFSIGVFPVEIKDKDGEAFVCDVIGESYSEEDVIGENRILGNVDSVLEYRLQKGETLTGLYYLAVANASKKEIVIVDDNIGSPFDDDNIGSPFDGEILAYNYEKKKYETIFGKDEKREIKNVKAYTGEDNILRLKLKVKDGDQYSYYAPVISATKKVSR